MSPLALFDLEEPKTKTGNQLSFRRFQMMALGATYGVPGILETLNEEFGELGEACRKGQCRSGEVRQLPIFLCSPQAFQVCGGSVVEADASPLASRCCCRTKHYVKIEGGVAKESAMQCTPATWLRRLQVFGQGNFRKERS